MAASNKKKQAQIKALTGKHSNEVLSATINGIDIVIEQEAFMNADVYEMLFDVYNDNNPIAMVGVLKVLLKDKYKQVRDSYVAEHGTFTIEDVVEVYTAIFGGSEPAKN